MSGKFILSATCTCILFPVILSFPLLTILCFFFVFFFFVVIFIYFGNTAQRKMFIFVRRVENDLARGKQHGLSPAYSSCSLIFLSISDMYKEKIGTVPKRVQIWYTVYDFNSLYRFVLPCV